MFLPIASAVCWVAERAETDAPTPKTVILPVFVVFVDRLKTWGSQLRSPPSRARYI